MPDNEEHAHDQEIAYMSIQYQYSCKLPNIILARMNLGECLSLKSKQFRDYFDIFIPTSSLHATLLSTMYLSELAVDVRMLEKFVTTTDNKCLADQVKIIVKKSQPIFTHAASLLVDQFLQSEVIYSVLLEIEICLRACTTFEPTSRYILEKWLYEYRSVKDKCSFAHIAAILLLEQGILSSSSIEILCHDILPSDIDWIQIRTRTCLNNVKCGIPWSHSLCLTLLKYALGHAQLSLYHVKDMQKLITLEREKATRLSYFQLIHFCSDEVKLFIEDLISSFNKDDEEHLACLIFHLGHFVKKSDKWFHILESLLRNDRLLCIHPAVTHILSLHRDSRKIIINFINDHANDSELHENTLIACLQALYSKSGNEDELNQLDADLCRLRHSTSSSILQNPLMLHAGACYLYYRCEIGTNVQKPLTCLDGDVSILYQIIMLNERAHLWANQLLYRFSSQLMSKFIADLSDILWDKVNNKCIAIFLLAVDWMVRNDPKKFCQAVRESSIDETLFKSGLYQACIRLESPLQTIPCPSHLTSTINHYSISRICLRVYSAFSSLTAEWIEIFFIHALEYNQYSLTHSINCIEHINHVEDRDLIESLFPYLKPTSMRHRYLVAYLLLHIASIDLLSFVEVYELLGEMINDSKSQQSFVGQGEKRHTLSEEIRHLLLNYSCIEVIEQDNSPLLSWTTAEVHYLKASDAYLPVSCVIADD